MMTSLVTDRPRGTREKVLPAAPQAVQIQATAEQIRLAQVIYDSNDTVFEDKVKQLMEVTGKNQDECMVALHDCNEDVNRAINFLLEGSSDTNSWETVGKKRGLPKEGSSSDKENKESREKRAEREAGRGRGGPNRRGRGAVRNREVCLEENGVDLHQGERGADRGRRGRGRASGGRGRGRAAGGSKFSSQGMGTFNPAEYSTDSNTAAGGSRSEDWETAVTEAVDGRGAWTVPQDDWATDDWAEDLSETKVFTASSAENHIPSGDSVDAESLLLKPVDGRESEDMGCVEPSSQSLAHSLVFTNSHHPHTNPTSYAHATLSSVLGSGFGNLGSSKLPLSAQILEQQKGPGIGQLAAEQAVSGGSSGSVGVSGALEVENPVPTSSWEAKPPVSQNTTVLSSPFGRDYKVQPEPSRVLSQLAQRQSNSLPRVQPATPPTAPATSAPSFESFSKPQDASSTQNGPSPVAKLSLPAGLPPPQEAIMQHKLKTQKRKIPPTSKIPLSAVEMPGSADVSGLNVQFGALDFGPEASLPDFSHPDNGSSGITSTNRDPVPVSQPLNSHYSKSPRSGAVCEPLGSPQSLPMSTSDSSYSSPSASLSTLPSSLPLSQTISAAPHSSSSSSTFDTNGPPHPHLTFSQGKEPTTSSVTNSFDCVRTSTALETAVASSAKPDCPQSSVSSSARPPVLLPSSTPSLSSELPTLSSQVTSLLSSCTLASSPSFTNTSVNSHSASVCVLSSAPAPLSASAVSVASAVHGTAVTGSTLGMSSNGAATLPGCRSTPLLQSSSGKAPPNLAQGVPPLLPSQYIMGPGGLLPAYPIYGYEELQMLQSRLPMDYYGVTFPGPAASLTGRDGSLSNSPYSGEMTKFGRGDSASPAPSTSLSAPPPPQAQQPLQSQAQQQPPGHHSGQQAFLNPALPPGYGYTGLPYYPGLPGMPSPFQYGPMFVSPASAKQHGVGLNNPSTQFQQASGYGQHAYGSGFDDLTQGPTGGEYGKGAYGSSTQTQAKSAATGPGKGISVSSNNAVGPDLSATVYNKAQSFDKQGFHTGTPPPFNLPSALGGAGPLNPGSGPGYAPAPFLHILPAHQQPHSQLLHHHHAQDSQGSSSQRSQSSSIQQKTPANKSTYGSSAYWGN
ncbi:ubiquitin-associated protein 2-like isoform X2 [Paramormyrops kingsleyae]|uniref:ubiquitin-associated protein 2-like isoform X2 n=1 Tax=Paramormyrops kingsleyae TaxID=1676925 RepID=UPI000CD5D0FB|nr:ubiquitin-associated protein 2-like isoform X2 [Paramormyrops kingsleyae]